MLTISTLRPWSIAGLSISFRGVATLIVTKSNTHNGHPLAETRGGVFLCRRGAMKIAEERLAEIRFSNDDKKIFAALVAIHGGCF